MSQDKRKKANVSRHAFSWFLAGCIGEFYLLLIRRFFVNGTLEQVLSWDTALPYLAIAGLAIAVVGLISGPLAHKKGKKGLSGWRSVSWWIFGTGLFVAVTSWLAHIYNDTALLPLCVIVPVVAFFGILWWLYDRECFYALILLGLTVLVLWLCRKGLGNMASSQIGGLTWHTVVLIGSGLYLLLIAVAALLARRIDHSGGLVGKLRLLPAGGDCLPIYIACGVSAVAVICGLFGTVIAYYAIWVVVLVIFALLVYYTVRQL